MRLFAHPTLCLIWQKAKLKVWPFRLFLLIASSIFLFPCGFYVLPGFGLESSWRLILNRAFSDGWTFGSRIIWTYGPLGFLDSRLPFGISRGYYLAFDGFVIAIFLLVLNGIFKNAKSKKVLAGVLVILCSSKVLITESPSSALFVSLGFLLAMNIKQPRISVSIGIALASFILFFFKMNFGIAGILLSVLVLGFRIGQKHPDVATWGFLVGSQLALIILLAKLFHIPLTDYIRQSLCFIRLYSTSMSAGPGRGGLPHFVICSFMAAYLYLVLKGFKHNALSSETIIHLMVASGVIFILFKSSIVRSDFLHNRLFLFGFPLISFGLFMHSSGIATGGWWALFGASASYAALLLVAQHGQFLIYTSKQGVMDFLPIHFFVDARNFSQYELWSEYPKLVSRTPERTVPEGLRQLIGTNAVDVFPFEATLPMGSGLNYQPRPVPQTYAVLGKELEDANLRFYFSPKAPKFVFYVLGERAASIDNRYILWEEPQLKHLLQEQFRVKAIFTNLQGTVSEAKPDLTPIAVLEAEPAHGRAQVRELFITNVLVGHTFDVPKQEGDLYARILFKKSFAGRVLDFFYRGGAVKVRFYLEDGSFYDYRFIPSTAESGALVNRFVDEKDPQSLLRYLSNRSHENARCVKLRFDCDRPWEYHRNVQVGYFSFANPKDDSTQQGQ